MIVLSAGLQKSGSGLVFNLTNDLLEASGQAGVRRLRERHGLEDLLKYHNCNLGVPDWPALRRLLPLHIRGHRFVVKTHRGPSRAAVSLARLGILRPTYVFRDPRDVLLSAQDHGSRLRAEGQTHTFAKCHDLDDTIPLVREWLKETVPWLNVRGTLSLRYEDLVARPLEQLERLAAFLGIDPGARGIDLAALYRVYDVRRNGSARTEGLHWNRGVSGRFRSEMSSRDRERCTAAFRPYLDMLGYKE